MGLHVDLVEPSGSARQNMARVLVVDDSIVARTVLSRIVSDLPGFAVAGAVVGTRAALDFLAANPVEIILLDIEMPDIDGLAALPDLLRLGGGARILVVSSACDEGGAAAVQALALGAADTLVKPGSGAFAGAFARALENKLTRLCDAAELVEPDLPCSDVPMPAVDDFDVVAIGASTGGIHALTRLLREIPDRFDLPILITQHLPESFMPYFATQVALIANRPCDVARDHTRIRPGRITIAPGGAHLRCVRTSEGTAIRLSEVPAPSGCMPSVDPMLESVAEVYGDRALAVVLSGMGRDGNIGAASIHAAGGTVAVQDQASSVVWGMPGTIVANGHAAAILPPDEIGALIARCRRPA